MSMLFDLRRVSAAEAETLVSNPDDIFFFLHGSEPHVPPPGFFARLFGAKQESGHRREWQAPADNMILSLDKNWHVIHFLLSSSAWAGDLPRSTLLCGGEELGAVDVGYGPARILQPPQISQFIDFLASLDGAGFGAGVSAAEFEENEIYGAYPDWSSKDAAFLWNYVEDLKLFLSKAKENDESIVMYLY